MSPRRSPIALASAFVLLSAACAEDSPASSAGQQRAPDVAAPTPQQAAQMPAQQQPVMQAMPVTAPQPAPAPAPTPMEMQVAGSPAPVVVDPAACGADPATTGDGICPGGLVCGDPTGTMNYACMCPANMTLLPPCTMGGSECAAYPGTTCSNLFGMQGCHTSCTPAGVAPPSCPDPLTCADPLGNGIAFCVMAGAITPPPCATQTDCDAYAGTFCMDPLGLGILGCVKSCVVQ